MVQIIQKRNPYGELGSALGRGLQGLAQNKLLEIQQRQQATGLQALIAQQNKQISPQQAEAIAQLHPDLLKEYVKGAFNPKAPVVDINVGGKKPLTPAQEKQRDSIRSSYEINKNLYETTQRMLADLKSGKVKTGLIPHLKAEYWPTQLNPETGIFAKDAANVLTWTTEGQKGLQSKYRIQQTLKGKPGVNQLPEVNEHVLTEINKRAERNLKNFQKDYPGFNLEDSDDYDYENKMPYNDEISMKDGEQLDEKPDASNLPDNTQWVEDNGERQIVKNGEWVPY